MKSGAAKLELHRIGYPTTDAPTDIDTLQRRIVELEQQAITVGRQLLYVSIRLNRNVFRIICHVRPATPSTLRETPITRHSGDSKNDYAGTMVDEGIEITAPRCSSDTPYGFMSPCSLSLLRRNVRSPVRIAVAANRQVATQDQTGNSPP